MFVKAIWATAASLFLLLVIVQVDVSYYIFAYLNPSILFSVFISSLLMSYGMCMLTEIYTKKEVKRFVPAAKIRCHRQQHSNLYDLKYTNRFELANWFLQLIIVCLLFSRLLKGSSQPIMKFDTHTTHEKGWPMPLHIWYTHKIQFSDELFRTYEM